MHAEGGSMERRYLNLTAENINSQHLCCIIRKNKSHPGVEAKRRWLSERINEGHVFRKLDVDGCVFIEYTPLEKARVPIIGDNFLYIYCLWVGPEFKGHGYGSELMEYCIDDARKNGRSGICMLGADKQKSWLSNQKFAEKYGFATVDTTADGYRLLAMSFDGTVPHFTPLAKKQSIDKKTLTIYYDVQCPFIPDRIEKLKKYCDETKIPADFILIDSLSAAKSLPCVFNNWAVFWSGRLITVNQIDKTYVSKIISQKDSG